MKMKIAQNIRALRKQHSFTQEQLSEVLGVTASAVYKWESGQSVPEVKMLMELADFINEGDDFFKDNSQFESLVKGEMSDETILSFLNKSTLKFEPGERFSYCNTNYYLLALILEQVTGKTT